MTAQHAAGAGLLPPLHAGRYGRPLTLLCAPCGSQRCLSTDPNNEHPRAVWQVLHKGTCVGTVVCKMDRHRGQQFRGYIAMLVVDKPYRKLRLGSKLVCAAFKVRVCE